MSTETNHTLPDAPDDAGHTDVQVAVGDGHYRPFLPMPPTSSIASV